MNTKFPILAVACYTLLTACTASSPEQYFDLAVLNCNMMHGFAGEGLRRELESPGVKLVEGTKDQTEPMKRTEIIDNKIQIIESNLEKIEKLEQTDDTKEMLQSSVALYQYVLPVYKNEYKQLARLYDESATKTQIESQEQLIENKYYSNFETLFNKLTSIAKPYAAKYNIQVKWDISTSPQ